MKKIIILLSLINILSAELYVGQIKKTCNDIQYNVSTRRSSDIGRLMNELKKRIARENIKSNCAYDIIIEDNRNFLKNRYCKYCKRKIK